MNKNFKENIKTICTTINTYIKSNSIDEIDILEDKLKLFADVDRVKLYQINRNQELVHWVDTSNNTNILISSGLLKEAINSKRIIFENHLTSNKYYASSIDNPLDIKVKSLLIFPIFDKKKVIGVALFYRSMGNRKVFNIKLEKEISELTDILYHLFRKKEIEKSYYLETVKKEKEKSSTKITVPQKNKMVKTKSNETNRLDVIQKTHTEYKSETEKLILKIEKSNQELEHENISYGKRLSELSEKIKKLEENNKDLKKKIQIVEKEKNTYVVDIQKLTETMEIQAKDKSKVEKNISLQNEQIEILEKENTTLLKSQKTIERKESNYTKKQSEKIIEQSRGHFGSSQYTRIVFELIAYAMYSEHGLTYMEDEFVSSGVLKKLLDKYSFRKTMVVNVTKSKISDVILAINNYEETIFNKKINLNIILGSDIPPSLYIDAKKIESIILHLLIDLFEFINHSEMIDIEIGYKNKSLVLDIQTSVHEKNSVFKHMLKKGDIFGNQNGRVSLEFAKKLLNYLNGSIKNKHKGNSYNYEVMIPAPIIKL